MLSDIVKYYSTPEIKIAISDDIKFDVIKMVEDYCKMKKYDIITIDGVKVFFKDGSALVRASNTGPNITVRFEAKTKERMEFIKSEFIELIDRIKKG